MFMVLLSLVDLTYSDPIIEAWLEAELLSIAISPSVTPGRVSMRACLQDDLPLMPTFDEICERDERELQAISAVAKDKEAVERTIASTRKIVGEFGPAVGTLVVLDVAQAYGFDA